MVEAWVGMVLWVEAVAMTGASDLVCEGILYLVVLVAVVAFAHSSFCK